MNRKPFSFVSTGDHRCPWACRAEGFTFYFTQRGFGLLHTNYRAGKSAVTIKGLFRYAHHQERIDEKAIQERLRSVGRQSKRDTA